MTRAFPDDIIEAVFALEFRAKSVDPLFERLLFDGTLDQKIQFFMIERLLNVVGGAQLHRFNGCFDRCHNRSS